MAKKANAVKDSEATGQKPYFITSGDRTQEGILAREQQKADRTLKTKKGRKKSKALLQPGTLERSIQIEVS